MAYTASAKALRSARQFLSAQLASACLTWPKPAGLPAQPSRAIDAEVSLAWDRSGLHHPGNNGRVYIVYTNANPTNPDDTYIAVRYSNDSGATWSNEQQVNDRNPSSQFLPAVAVDQTTRLGRIQLVRRAQRPQ